MLGKPFILTRKNLEANGRSAPATILTVGKHGITMASGNGSSWNNEIALKVSLRVEPADEPPFEWSGRLRFQQSSTPGRGGQVWVRYDATNHKRLMLDETARFGAWSGVTAPEVLIAGARPPAASAAPTDAIGQLERLAELHERGALTDEEFDAQKRRVLGT